MAKPFREKEDARYVGLTLPRFFACATPMTPADKSGQELRLQEKRLQNNHEDYLWGKPPPTFANTSC